MKAVLKSGSSRTKKEPPMYIFKVKGKAKIPDYVQLRNEDFVLVASNDGMKNAMRWESALNALL